METDAVMSRAHRGQSFGHWLWTERTRRGFSRPELVKLIRKAALEDGVQGIGCNEKYVRRWENHEVKPSTEYQRWIAKALDTPIETVTSLIQRRASNTNLAEPVEPVTRADADYVASIRSSIQQLVSLEIQNGGNEVAPLAVRLTRNAQRRIDSGAFDPSIQPELIAATTELAEVAGWMLHDANQQEHARSMLYEALYLAHSSNDQAMISLVLSILTWVDFYSGRPGSALTVARSQLETPKLTARLETIFLVREARALNRLGDQTGARVAFERAASTLQDGISRRDYPWATWMDPAELLIHSGEAFRDVDSIARAVEGCPTDRIRRKFGYLASLFKAQVELGDEHGAEETLSRVLPYIGEINSGVVLAKLANTTQLIQASDSSSTLKDAGQHLAELLSSTN